MGGILGAGVGDVGGCGAVVGDEDGLACGAEAVEIGEKTGGFSRWGRAVIADGTVKEVFLGDRIDGGEIGRDEGRLGIVRARGDELDAVLGNDEEARPGGFCSFADFDDEFAHGLPGFQNRCAPGTNTHQDRGDHHHHQK